LCRSSDQRREVADHLDIAVLAEAREVALEIEPLDRPPGAGRRSRG
jgi:hypothetical protein